ncbi:MAG: hypothetical protein RL744_646 [Pseudomonadota bacterium]|jgi:hypothetical protein
MHPETLRLEIQPLTQPIALNQTVFHFLQLLKNINMPIGYWFLQYRFMKILSRRSTGRMMSLVSPIKPAYILPIKY